MILTIIFLLIPIIGIISFILDGDIAFYITGIMSLIGCFGLLINCKIHPKSIILWVVICWICTKWASIMNAIILGTCVFIGANSVLFLALMLLGISKPLKTIRKNDNQLNQVHRSETTIPCLSKEDNLRMIFQNHFLQKLKTYSIPNDDNALYDRTLLSLVNEACEELKNGSRTKLLFLNLSDIDEFAVFTNRTIDANKVLEEEKWKFLQENYKTYFNQRQANIAYINIKANG